VGARLTATEDLLQLADLLRARDDAVRPAEVLRPSEWAERYRHLTSGPYAGSRWDNTISPYLVDVMDAAQEALETHRDLAVMKMAQGGVTEALGVNVVAWLIDNFGGPILYLTSVHDTAVELVRDRWDGVLSTCEPLKRKRAEGPAYAARDKALVKRFTDAKLVLGGSHAMSRFISQPYAVVVFDELDACQDEQSDGSDPIELVRRRMAAFREARDVLLIAFAHPSERERGIAKIYYEQSDQRRAHLRCAGSTCASPRARARRRSRPSAIRPATALPRPAAARCSARPTACA
jgi:phage terminase large subunit GpA-like protein